MRFNFLKKGLIYYCNILVYSFLLLIVFFSLFVFIYDKSILGIIISSVFLLILIIALCFFFLKYKRNFEITEGKLKFFKKANLYTNVINAFPRIYSEEKNVSISSIPFIFITTFEYSRGRGIIREKEKIDGKKQVCGYMFLLDKFIYNEERCKDSYTFESLNRREDFISQSYNAICSMCYQKEVLNELFLNGFNGKIYIKREIYEPRKADFDNLFFKHNYQINNLHII